MPIKEELRLEFMYISDDESGPSYFVEVCSENNLSVVNISNAKGATPIISCSPDFLAEVVDFLRKKDVVRGVDIPVSEIPSGTVPESSGLQIPNLSTGNTKPGNAKPFASFDMTKTAAKSVSITNKEAAGVSNMDSVGGLKVPEITGLDRDLGKVSDSTVNSPMPTRPGVEEGGTVIHGSNHPAPEIKRPVIRTRNKGEGDPMGAIAEAKLLRGPVNSEKSVKSRHR